MSVNFKKSNLISLLIVLFVLLSSISVFGQEDNINKTEVNLSRFEKYDIKSNVTSLNRLDNSTQEKEAYTYIKDSLIGLDDNINIEDFELKEEQFDYLMKKILVENPDIFYIRNWDYYYYLDSGIVISITPKYDYNKKTITSMRSEISSKVNYILNSVIKNDMTDFQKELAIHDYLVLNSKYDPNILPNGNYAKESHSIYGTLVNGIGVCESYAESFKLLLNKVGIESMVVMSTPEMNHAWNMVNLDGEYYHVDVTWDDPLPDEEGVTNYNYLNLTDNKIGEDHYWDNKKYPSCTSKYYSYLWDMNNIRITFKDIKTHWAKESIEDFIGKGYISGYPDGKFKPQQSITRAEFVTIFNKVFGLSKKNGKVFSDTKTHWAKESIDIAVTNGVANGMSQTEFAPNSPITREQAAKMVANYKKIADVNHDKLSGYSDKDSVSNWAKNEVEGVIEKGYMSGYPDGSFKPRGKITRAEAVSTLDRVIKKP